MHFCASFSLLHRDKKIFMNRKSTLLANMLSQLESALTSLSKDIQSLRDSRASDGKSTAGDKHETARAMVDQELKQLENQQAKTAKMRADLLSLSLAPSARVQAGSLVETARGTFFLSVSLGKINESDGRGVFAVSPISPIAQAMLSLEVGDAFEVNGVANEVKAVS